MSVVQMTLVFRHSRSEGAARLVLLALADVAADTGEVTAYARSQTILARKANVTQATVARAIKSLEKLHELVVLEAGGGRKSASYRLTIAEPHHVEGPHDDGADPSPRAGTPRDTRGVPHHDDGSVSPSGSIGAPSSPVEQPLPMGPTFVDFWNVYPRHVSRKAAEQAWAKAVRKHEPSAIMDGARRYAVETSGRATEHIAHPTTWLNQERWRDEPGANGNRRPTGPTTPPGAARRDGTEGRVQL